MNSSTADLMVLLHMAINTAISVAAPLLLTGLSVGLVVGVLQAATQVHEAALTFVPKLVATGTLLTLAGPYLIDQLSTLMRAAMSMVAGGTP